MKKYLIIPMLLLGLIACETDSSNGKLILKGVKKFSSGKQSTIAYVQAEVTGEPVVHKMYTKEIFMNIAEVWVSQKEVEEDMRGEDFEWVLVGKEKNKLMTIADFNIQNSNMPPGSYKSMKIVFRNAYKRLSVGYDDPSIQMEQNSALTGGAPNDKEFVTNYFSKYGNHSLMEDGVFKLASRGENIRGFEVLEGKTSIIEWMSGIPGMDPKDVYFDWYDNNGNGKWDDGDRTANFTVDPKYDGMDIPMFSFNVIIK